MSAIFRPRTGRSIPTTALPWMWENYPDKAKQLKAISDEAKKADTLILATDPDREGEAISWHVQEVLRKKKAAPGEGRAGDLQRHHQGGGDRGDEASARARRGSDRRLPGAPRARLSGRIHAVADPVAQAARRQVGGAGAVGRASPDRRPRARDRTVPGRRNIGRSAPPSKPTGTPFSARLVELDGKKLERLSIGDRAAPMRPRRWSRTARFTVA